MDTAEIRKYERLTSVKDRFEAYLPFWYFLGHSAKFISEDKNNGLEPAARNYYRAKAKEYFEQFDSRNSFNILREDELTASFALEYIDLLLLDDKPDMDKITRLIKTAVEMAGNANDILELCAFAYLKVGQTEEAEKLLRILVNENYNTATNAKLLSRIYVTEYLKGTNPLARTQYGILATRVTQAWLFPMPEQRSDNLMLQDATLQDKYLADQRTDLQKEYSDAITQFIEKYIILFNRIIPVPVIDARDEYFLNTEAALKRRRQDVYDALENDENNEYRKAIRESGYRFRYIELINEMLRSLDGLRFFRESEDKDAMISLIRENLIAASGDLKEIQEKLNQDSAFTIVDYEKIQKSFSFQKLTKEFFDTLLVKISDGIDSVKSLDELDDLELDIVQFCRAQNISERNANPSGKIGEPESDDENDYISQDVLGEDEHDESFVKTVFQKMLSLVKESTDSIVEDSSKVDMIMRGEQKFDLYFKNVKLQGEAFKGKTLAILDDHSSADSDLFITCDGVVQVKHNKVDGLRTFDRIEYQGKSIKLGWPQEYSNKAVNLGSLYSLLEKLRNVRNNA